MSDLNNTTVAAALESAASDLKAKGAELKEAKAAKTLIPVTAETIKLKLQTKSLNVRLKAGRFKIGLREFDLPEDKQNEAGVREMLMTLFTQEEMQHNIYVKAAAKKEKKVKEVVPGKAAQRAAYLLFKAACQNLTDESTVESIIAEMTELSTVKEPIKVVEAETVDEVEAI